MIIEKAYAKINLALEVMNVKDGYHMVNNLMVPIDLYDELSFELNDDIELVNNEYEDNIILKATKLFINEFNIKSGVKIKLNKKIPAEAGLGGGSSDAAATLRGLNKLFNVNATDDKLLSLASKLGSDVPFFIKSKLALCTNRGEKVNIINKIYKPINILLLKPKTGCSTKAVYNLYKYDGKEKRKIIDEIITNLERNEIEKLNNNIFNDLLIPALNVNNELKEIYNDLKPKTNIQLSGSGSTLFIIEPTEEMKQYINKKYSQLYTLNTKIL